MELTIAAPIALVAGMLVGLLFKQLWDSRRSSYDAREDQLKFSEEPLVSVRALLSLYEQRYRRSAFRWKVSYRALLVASAVASTAAAIVPKLNYFRWEASSDWASILASVAAVITTLVAALDFEVNWRGNRKSRHEVNVVRLEANKATADPDKLLTDLQAIVKKRNDDLTKQEERQD